MSHKRNFEEQKIIPHKRNYGIEQKPEKLDEARVQANIARLQVSCFFFFFCKQK